MGFHTIPEHDFFFTIPFCFLVAILICRFFLFSFCLDRKFHYGCRMTSIGSHKFCLFLCCCFCFQVASASFINDSLIDNRQEKVHSLRLRLQSISKKFHHHHHHHHPHHQHHDRQQQIDKEDKVTCGPVFEKRLKLVLVKALETWAPLNCGNVSSANWSELVANSLLSVSRKDKKPNDDAHCLSRTAVNTMRLLLLDSSANETQTSLSTILRNCSNDGGEKQLVHLMELVVFSDSDADNWHREQLASRDGIVKQLSLAQRLLLSKSALNWSQENVHCFNTEDTAHYSFHHHQPEEDASELLDSAAVDSLLYLSLGYIPDEKCPSVENPHDEEHFLDVDDEDEIDEGEDYETSHDYFFKHHQSGQGPPHEYDEEDYDDEHNHDHDHDHNDYYEEFVPDHFLSNLRH